MNNKTEKKFRAKVEKLYKEGKSIPEIRDAVKSIYPGSNDNWLYNKCKKAVYKLQGRYSNGSNPNYHKGGAAATRGAEVPPVKGKITGKSQTIAGRGNDENRTLVFTVEGDAVPSDDQIMKAFGLSPDEYEVVSTNATSNDRYYVSLDEYRTSTKCTVKVAKRESFKLQQAVNIISKDLNYNKIPKRKTVYRENTDDRHKVLEIDLADFHYGLKSLKPTTGEDYNCEIAKKTLFLALEKIAKEVEGIKYKKVIFASLGDFLHVDNGKQTTTSGTFQQIDGDIYNIAASGAQVMIEAIEFVKANIDTPIVEYINVQGNHDRETGTMLGSIVQAAFRNDESIICDIGPNPNKVRVIGGCPVIYCHGDIKNLGELPISQFKDEYLRGTHPTCRIHAGHFHSLKILPPKGNVVVKHFPTICGSSIWEHQQGYNSPKALGYTEYNLETGSIKEGYVYTEM